MSYEYSFNKDLARNLARAKDPEKFLDGELVKIKTRALELNHARTVMAEGYTKVLEGLKLAFPDLDLNDQNLVGTPNRMARALLEVCSGMGTNQKEIFFNNIPC